MLTLMVRMSISRWLLLKWWENNRGGSRRPWIPVRAWTLFTSKKHWKKSTQPLKSSKRRRNSWYRNLPDMRGGWASIITCLTKFRSRSVTFTCFRSARSQDRTAPLCNSHHRIMMNRKKYWIWGTIYSSLGSKHLVPRCFHQFIHPLKRKNYKTPFWRSRTRVETRPNNVYMEHSTTPNPRAIFKSRSRRRSSWNGRRSSQLPIRHSRR